MGTLLKVWGGEGRGEASLRGWRREGRKELSFSAYLPSSFEGSYGKW